MSKLNILVPLDGTEKSMHSLDWLKKFYSKEDTEVTLINVIEVIYYGEAESIDVLSKLKITESVSNRTLDVAASRLEGYKVNKLSVRGFIPDRILTEAKDGKYDIIIMTKSSVKGLSRVIGSVTNKIIHNSEAAVVVLPE